MFENYGICNTTILHKAHTYTMSLRVSKCLLSCVSSSADEFQLIFCSGVLQLETTIQITEPVISRCFVPVSGVNLYHDTCMIHVAIVTSKVTSLVNGMTHVCTTGLEKLQNTLIASLGHPPLGSIQ